MKNTAVMDGTWYIRINQNKEQEHTPISRSKESILIQRLQLLINIEGQIRQRNISHLSSN